MHIQHTTFRVQFLFVVMRGISFSIVVLAWSFLFLSSID